MSSHYCSKIESLSLTGLRDELVKRGIAYTTIFPYNEDAQREAWIDLLLSEPTPTPCEESCEGNVPETNPLYIPVFHTTYQPTLTNRYPNKHLEYALPCGGSCSCGPRCIHNCNTITQEQHNNNVLQHGPNYIGTSKKSAYGQYIQRTPGMYTFASKKIPQLQKLAEKNDLCFKTYWCRNK
jgi:hypothetical protein